MAEHDPRCFQMMGVPVDLPEDVCDCKVWKVLDSATPDDLKKWALDPLIIEAELDQQRKEARGWLS